MVPVQNPFGADFGAAKVSDRLSVLDHAGCPDKIMKVFDGIPDAFDERCDDNGWVTLRHEVFLESFSRMCSAPTKSVILDLSGVIFIASMGISMLLIGCKLIKNLGGKVALVAPHPEIKNVLNISGFDRIVDVFDDINSAAKSIG